MPFYSIEISACHFLSCYSTFYLSLLTHTNACLKHTGFQLDFYWTDFTDIAIHFFSCFISLPHHKTVQPHYFPTNIFISHFSSFVPLHSSLASCYERGRLSAWASVRPEVRAGSGWRVYIKPSVTVWCLMLASCQWAFPTIASHATLHVHR